MKAGFALNITDEGLGLLHRTSQGWMPLGEAKFDDPALAETLGYLRGTATAMAPGGVTTKLIIPNTQILYTKVRAVGSARETKRKNVRAALDGLTPYALDDLVFDFTGSGEEVQVAVVARETLDQAESFALEHRLNPISFVALPDPEKFDGEPFFGATINAAEFLPKGTKVEADKTAVNILAVKSSSTSALAEPAAENPAGDPADRFVAPRPERPDAEKSAFVAPVVVEPVIDAPPTAASEPIVSQAMVTGDAPAAAEVKVGDTAASPSEPDGSAAAAQGQTPRFGLPDDEKLPLAATPVLSDPIAASVVAPLVADPAPDADDSAAPAFASRRGADEETGQGAGIAGAMAKSRASDKTADPVAGKAAADDAGSEKPDTAKPDPAEKASRLKSVVPPAPPRGNGGALPSGLTAPVRKRVEAPIAASQRAGRKPTEARRDAFGTRQPDTGRRKPRYMGLILTAALLLALTLAALLSSVLLPKDADPQLGTPDGIDGGSAVAPLPNEGTPTATPEAAPATTDPEAAADGEAPSEESPATDTPTEAPADGQAPEADPATAPTNENDAAIDAQMPDTQAAVQPDQGLTESTVSGSNPSLAAGDEDVSDLSPSAEAGGPAAGTAPATSGAAALPEVMPLNIATSAPDGPAAPDDEALAGLVLSRVDPDVHADDGVQLPETAAADGSIAAPETALAAVSDPVTGTVSATPVAPDAGVPDIASPAVLVAATPEGALTPDGIIVRLGRPAVVPPARPESVRTAAAAAQAALGAADAISAATAEANALTEAELAPNPLADIRPRLRPAGLVPAALAPVVEPALAPATNPDPVPALPATGLATEDDAALPVAPVVQAVAFAGPRPTARPAAVVTLASVAPAPEVTAAPSFPGASALAVAISRVPTARPRIVTPVAVRPDAVESAAIEAAVASAARPVEEPQPEPQREAEPEAQDEPEAETVAAAPTRGSVAKTATVANAINLSKVNLIGVYGSAKNRRALIRTENGRYVKVEVGDRIDGGKVAAIGENQVSYVKGGRTVVLKMLRGT
ncbi:MAG: hypothetical protein ACRCSU_01025 [Paracoccaceae bacterium]